MDADSRSVTARPFARAVGGSAPAHHHQFALALAANNGCKVVRQDRRQRW